MDLVYWDSSYNDVIFINLAIVIALFASLRIFSGTIAHINASDELLKKDNPAFGISLAGVTFAITILLSGAIYGNYGDDLIDSAFYVALFGVLGIALMALTRIIFDKITLPDISLRDEIKNGNVAVAIADTSNVLATAIIIRAIMIWIDDKSWEGIVALLVAFAISQVILTLSTYIRRHIFPKLYNGRLVQEELKNGNIALALSFAGKKIATAFAISVAANIVVYEVYDIKTIFLPWIIVSIGAIVIINLISFVAERIILFQVSTMREILEQRNIAIGAFQAIIYISIALLIAEL